MLIAKLPEKLIEQGAVVGKCPTTELRRSRVFGMRWFNSKSVLTSLLAMIFPALPSWAEPQYRQRVEYFDISGHVNSRREMWDAIRDWGPSQNLNSYIVGQAKPRIGYSYQLRQRKGRCRFEKLDVTVGVVLRLPSWDLKDFAKPDLRRYFACVLRTVTVHEKRHAQIAYEAGERIEARFMSELNGGQCRGFAERAKSVYHEVLAEHGRRQADFDQRDYARRRYEKCNSGSGGPEVALSSRPKKSRSARHSVPSRRFDKPRDDSADRLSASGRQAMSTPRAARQVNPQQDAGEGRSLSFEATRTLLGSAGTVLVAGFTVLGLFAAFMWGAASYERRRELEALRGDEAGDGDTAGGGLPRPRTGGLRSAKQAGRPAGFGKRGRR